VTLTFQKLANNEGTCKERCSRSGRYAVLLFGYPLDGQGERTAFCGACRKRLMREWDEALEPSVEAVAA
jgi:hypothetical protein